LMILTATLVWATEVIVAKQLLSQVAPLTLAAARMGVGLVVLLAWAVMRGEAGTLIGLDAAAWSWAILTGALLTVYVLTWYAALARAQAVDVTAVLVFGAVITAILDLAVKGTPVPDDLGLVLVVAGSIAAAVLAMPRRHLGMAS
jgi:uncharacterized membrane protein